MMIKTTSSSPPRRTNSGGRRAPLTPTTTTRRQLQQQQRRLRLILLWMSITITTVYVWFLGRATTHLDRHVQLQNNNQQLHHPNINKNSDRNKKNGSEALTPDKMSMVHPFGAITEIRDNKPRQQQQHAQQHKQRQQQDSKKGGRKQQQHEQQQQQQALKRKTTTQTSQKQQHRATNQTKAAAAASAAAVSAAAAAGTVAESVDKMILAPPNNIRNNTASHSSGMQSSSFDFDIVGAHRRADYHKVIPPWMDEYFAWHATHRAKLNESNWHQYRYLVSRCTAKDIRCSGLADRLFPMPLVVLLAYQSNRLFFIHWEKPAPLQEFLVPPPPSSSPDDPVVVRRRGGLDWRLPDWLVDKLHIEKYENFVRMEADGEPIKDPNRIVAAIRNVHEVRYYKKHRKRGERGMTRVIPAVWEYLFTPIPPIRDLIRRSLVGNNLAVGRYVAVHVRTLYAGDATDDNEQINAIHCAEQLRRPGEPMLVASDSLETVRRAVEYGTSLGIPMVTRLDAGGGSGNTKKNDTSSSSSSPAIIHFDRGSHWFNNSGNDWHAFRPSAYYNAVVDLYLLSSARCVVYGMGGFGQLANVLSHDMSCFINHRRASCPWPPPEKNNTSGPKSTSTTTNNSSATAVAAAAAASS